MDNKPFVVKTHDVHLDSEYRNWIADLKQRYQASQVKAAVKVNSEQLLFNWQLGRDLVIRRAEEKWGKGVVEQVSLDMQAAFPHASGFSARNLWNMKKWYSFYASSETKLLIPKLEQTLEGLEAKLQQVAAELPSEKLQQAVAEFPFPVSFGYVPWGHHILIITKAKSVEEALFYIRKTIEETEHNHTSVEDVKPVAARSTSSSKAEIQELVILSIAEQFKVGESRYPEYLRAEYGIGFPNEIFRSLEKKGYIRQSTAVETLPFLKATELKAIASEHGLKVSGKKDDLISRIAENMTEEEIAPHLTERYWKRTDLGESKLNEKPHISLYMDKHEYTLSNIGLDIFTFSKLYDKPLNGSVRDRLWGEFNRLTMEFYSKAMTKGDFQDYCELLRIMALYLKEEGRYKDALSQYMRYLHYRANFKAALPALQHYGSIGFVDNDAVVLTVEVELMPYTAQEIISISEGCGFDSAQLRAFMLDAFSKEKDTGLFNPQELTELTMLGLNGDREGQKKICVKAMKAALKKMPKKKKR